MRITGTPGLPATLTTSDVAESTSARSEPTAASASPAAAELQSAVMQPALAALRDLPDIDHAKVATLRAALAKGELPFDASKLAGLIERFHGGRS